MRIGVVSDTHLRRMSELPERLSRGLEGVDLILHAGDWTDERIVELFETIAPVESVAGNNDPPEIVHRFGRRKEIEVAGIRIGLIHGDSWTHSAEECAWNAFAACTPDIIVFGHSHVPHLEQRGQTLLFNPGSPTDKRFQPQYSFGILEISGGKIEARHIFYEKL